MIAAIAPLPRSIPECARKAEQAFERCQPVEMCHHPQREEEHPLLPEVEALQIEAMRLRPVAQLLVTQRIPF
jgi:hypothetical protein